MESKGENENVFSINGAGSTRYSYDGARLEGGDKTKNESWPCLHQTQKDRWKTSGFLQGVQTGEGHEGAFQVQECYTATWGAIPRVH